MAELEQHCMQMYVINDLRWYLLYEVANELDSEAARRILISYVDKIRERQRKFYRV